MIRALDHLVLTVRDLPATERFYVELLGMQAVQFGEGRRALRFGAQKINLHVQGQEIAPHAMHPVAGSADLCLLIEGGPQELQRMRQRLVEAGIELEAGPVARAGATGPIESLYLRDPDGNLLELSCVAEVPLPAVSDLPCVGPAGTEIRAATPADAAGCLSIYAPIIEDTHSSFEDEVPSVQAFSERIASYAASHDWLVAIREGEVLAYAYTCPHRERAAYAIACEASVYVAESARRSGLARGLYEEVLARAAARGLHRVYAIITLPNETSVAFHESMGFRPLAHFPAAGRKFGRFWDVGWWARGLA